MKKTARKLVLRGETIHVLTNSALTRAVGGIDSQDPCVVRVAAPATAAGCTVPGA
jgi:hypothetical protein